jgi:pyridoxamine 5'-phosphate oxidase
MMNKLADIRKDYTQRTLDITDVNPNPIEQFRIWFDECIMAEITEPNAMTLASVQADGMPACRVVLLKEVNDEGFVFYTNYASDKGKQLIENGKAALNFFWKELERQVRIEGYVQQVDGAISDEYFNTRPRESQIGAWVSPQSREIENRTVLAELFTKISQQYEGQAVPRPPHWGGFLVNPVRIEFWQGRASRLHDRICYQKNGTDWTIKRLAP